MYVKLVKNKFRRNTDGYAIGYIDKKHLALSRYIMNYNGKNYVDHINGNRLDNRLENLRVVTPTQNARNKRSRQGSSSQYVGVTFEKKSKKWVAQLKIGAKNIKIGRFVTEYDAHIARKQTEQKYWNEQ